MQIARVVFALPACYALQGTNDMPAIDRKAYYERNEACWAGPTIVVFLRCGGTCVAPERTL